MRLDRDPDPVNGGGAENGIPALERACDVLDALATEAPLTIREVAACAGLARSTAYRTLNTLEGRRLVQRVGEGSYALGPHLAWLARAVRAGIDLVSIARPHLADLAASIQATAKLSIVEGGEALVVAVAEAPGAYSVTTRIGRRFPLHAGAASKLLLAYLPPERRAEALAAPLRQVTAATITDPEALARALDEIRARGVAMDRGEFADGVHAVAAPVMDRDGACLAAVSVPFLPGPNRARTEEIAQAVVRAAGRVSRELGG